MGISTKREEQSPGRSPLLKLLAILCVLAISVGLAACGGDSDDDAASDAETTAATDDTAAGGDDAASQEEVSIGFMGLAAINVYSMTMFEAAEEAAAELNAKIEFLDGEFDGGVQNRQIQDAITSGRYDGLIIMPNDAVGIVPAVEQAIDAGIAVSALQFPIGNDPTDVQPQVEGIVTTVAENVVRGAEVTAEGVNQACEGRDPCKVLMLWGARQTDFEQAKVEPFESKLDPNVQVVNQADTQFLRDEARRVTTDVLQGNPDLDVVASTGDQMTYGAEEAILAAGKTIGTGPDDVVLIGYGATYEGVEKIKAGEWLQAFALLPQTMAKKALELTVAAIRGEEIAEDEVGIDQSDLSPIGDVATAESLEQDPDFKGEYPAD